MNINELYNKLDNRLTNEDFWWLYVTLKHRFLNDNKYADYVYYCENDTYMTNRLYEVLKAGYYSSNVSYKPTIKKVIFNPPATIIMWNDGTKSVVKCQNGEVFDAEKGFALAYLKKLLGNDNTFNKEINKWVKYDAVD